ncbi:MAG: helix-turn-helix transcriptional regulator [Bdellovibrionota bacterium]
MTTNKYGLRELEKEFGALTFGRLLKSHRLGENLSQTDLAKILKISKQSLNDLENGRTFPSISRAAAIARKIGVMEAMMVELCIQGLIDRQKLNLVVKIEEVKNRKRAS